MKNALLLVAAFGVVHCVTQAASRTALAAAPTTRPEVKLGALKGAWEGKDPDGQKVLRLFADGRLVRWSRGTLVVLKITQCTDKEITLKVQGQKKAVRYQVQGDDLTLTQPGPGGGDITMTARRMKETPEELLLRPMKLGKPAQVTKERVAEIQSQLTVRLETDQKVRRKMSMGPSGVTKDDIAKMIQTDRENTAYLKKLIGEIGWIDGGRFGAAAANAAFLIVQHSGDLPLMLAALPEIEKDVKGGKADGQAFALLYDRTQLMLGERQRYGSQIGSVNGKMAILPLEDRQKVAEYRKSLGMMPLGDYVKLFGVDMKDVVFLEDEP